MFAKAGAQLALADIHAEGLKEVANLIAKAGGTAIIKKTDAAGRWRQYGILKSSRHESLVLIVRFQKQFFGQGGLGELQEAVRVVHGIGHKGDHWR